MQQIEHEVQITKFKAYFSVMFVMDFLKPDIQYCISRKIFHTQDQNDIYRLLYSDSTGTKMQKEVPGIEYLLELSEEELFQLSCTVDYDIYLVIAGLKELRLVNSGTEYLRSEKRTTLRY